jgi:hypothetical protein
VPNRQLRAITKASALQVKRSHLVRGMCCRSTNSPLKEQRSILLWGYRCEIASTTPRLCGRVHVGEQGRLAVRRQSGETRLTPGLATNLDTSGSGCRLACGALIRSGKVVFLSGSARIVVEFPADEYITLAQSLPSSKGKFRTLPAMADVMGKQFVEIAYSRPKGTSRGPMSSLSQAPIELSTWTLTC